MNRNPIVFYLLLVFLYSCSENSPNPNVSISGIVPAAAGEMLYLEELEPTSAVLLDSSLLDESGSFNFDQYVTDAGFYVLRTSTENNIILLLEENEKVIVSTENDDFSSNVAIQGSPGSALIQDFEDFMDFQRNRIDSLAEVYYEARGTPAFFDVKLQLDSIYLSFVEDQRDYIFDFITEHPSSLASLLILNRKLGNTEVIREKDDYTQLCEIDSALQLHYPDNKHIKDHQKRVLKIKGEIFDDYVMEEKLSPGKRAPDIILNDTSGQPVSLKSYTNQKVILYFWAGWDARSRRDNSRLKRLYSQFRDKNIELIGISFDENSIVWKGAIGLDQLFWPQLSDLKGIYSPIKKSYHIPDELPFYYLIDENQKIVYKSAILDSLLVHLN